MVMIDSAVGDFDNDTAASGIGKVASSSASAIPRLVAKGMITSHGRAPTRLMIAHIAKDTRQPKASAAHTPATAGAVALIAIAVAYAAVTGPIARGA
jgi:hypothetical protein